MPCVICGQEFEHEDGPDRLDEVIRHFEQVHWAKSDVAAGEELSPEGEQVTESGDADGWTDA